jgi:peptidoglycan hydrolase-like protein with peptidoglycan-binding domain
MAQGEIDPILGLVVLGAAYFILKSKSSTASTGSTASQIQALANTIPATPTVGGDAYVATVQGWLNQLFPGSNIAVDGIMGPQTRKYIIMFQQIWGIPATGIIGAETDYDLRAAMAMPGYTDQPYGGGNVGPTAGWGGASGSW